jgi:hypothetical protein
VPELAREQRVALGLRATVQPNPAIEWYVGVLAADHAAAVATPHVPVAPGTAKPAADVPCRALGMARPQAAPWLTPPAAGFTPDCIDIPGRACRCGGALAQQGAPGLLPCRGANGSASAITADIL